MENTSVEKESVIVRVGDSLTKLSKKYMPDPTIFAIMLTILAYALTVWLTESTAGQVLDYWYQGFWELLSFAMQMALVVITGGAVGQSSAVKEMISKLAYIPKNGKQAAMFVCFVSIFLCYIHYGLGMIISSILAKEIGLTFYKEKKAVSYNMLGAAAYSGMGVWGLGLSTSIGLTIATDGHFLQDMMGIVPFNQFIFHPLNIWTALLSIIILPIFVYYIHPKSQVIAIPKYVVKMFDKAIQDERHLQNVKSEVEEDEIFSIGDRLNNSNVIGMGVGLIGLGYILYRFYTLGFAAFNLNSLNGLFLFLGIVLHKNIVNYTTAFAKSTVNSAGIIFQFPLYAGIMGIIQYSGMVTLLADSIVSISSPSTFFVIMLLVASIVNMFVPSGGGQWAVQGPIAMQAANILGQSSVTTALVVAFGNSLTNLAQPFWAISILGVTGLKAKDLMGYSMAIMLALTAIMFGTTIVYSFLVV